MEGVAFWGGLAVLFIGVVLVVVIARVSRRRRNDPRLAHQPGRGGGRADDVRSGPVALRGSVVAGADGLVREPLSGVEVVWYRLTAFAPRAGDRSYSDHTEVYSERGARDFLLDDGSRSPPRVSVDDAGFVVPMDMYGGTSGAPASGDLRWTQHELSEQHVALLRARCGRSTTRMIRADSHALAPGTVVTVVGWLERVGGDAVLVGRPPDHPLIVYGVAEEVLRHDRATRTRNRRIARAIGLMLVVVGVAGLWWGRSTLGLS